MTSKITKNKKNAKPERKKSRLSGLQIAIIIISVIVVLSMVLSMTQI